MRPEWEQLRARARAVAAQGVADHGQWHDSWINGHSKEFSRILAAEGWIGMTWPVEYGGGGRPGIERIIMAEEMISAGAPIAASWFADRQMGPSIYTYGTDRQKAEFLGGMLSGEATWCIGMSEPDAGSDLAALKTSAARDGDHYVVNGQKIWTTGAHFSDYAILVLRTDPNVPKHKGLTYFFVDMKSPGIEVKPIKQISGGSGFNEVYFTDVRVSDAQRLGAVGQGWQVAITTLMNERASIGAGGGGAGFRQLFDLAQRVHIDDRPAIEDKSVRAKLADWYVQEAGLRYTGYRSLSALSRGEIPGPENSIGKYVGAAKGQDMASFAMDLLEQSGAITDPEFTVAAGLYQDAYMGAPGGRIAGGTDEIMLNILAERVLGLPQDVRVDKGIPFNEVPTGGS